MILTCPNCGNKVRLTDRSCPACGSAFGPLRLSRLFGQSIARWSTRVTALRCPSCQRTSPLRAKICGHCGQSMTVQAAVEAALLPLHHRWQAFLQHASPKTMKRIQWGYLGLSLALLWGLLGYAETQSDGRWIGSALLSVLYLTTFLLLAALLVPKYVWATFALRTSRLVKLAVVVNYLTVLLLLQQFIGAWPMRATILAALFVVSWAGAWLLCHFFWPAYVQTANILLGGGNRDFDASDPQGRTVRSG